MLMKLFFGSGHLCTYNINHWSPYIMMYTKSMKIKSLCFVTMQLKKGRSGGISLILSQRLYCPAPMTAQPESPLSSVSLVFHLLSRPLLPTYSITIHGQYLHPCVWLPTPWECHPDSLRGTRVDPPSFTIQCWIDFVLWRVTHDHPLGIGTRFFECLGYNIIVFCYIAWSDTIIWWIDTWGSTVLEHMLQWNMYGTSYAIYVFTYQSYPSPLDSWAHYHSVDYNLSSIREMRLQYLPLNNLAWLWRQPWHDSELPQWLPRQYCTLPSYCCHSDELQKIHVILWWKKFAHMMWTKQ